MIMYASRTGTRHNLDLLAMCGWRLLVSATGVHRTEGFARYAIDNGAWTAFQQKRAFDVAAFDRAVSSLGSGADFVVVPDVVADADGTRRAADLWLPRLNGLRLYLAVQDGMSPADLDAYPCAGAFVGGSTQWKLRTAHMWRHETRARGMFLHVARVNSERRIEYCRSIGATSVDGTSATKFSVTTKRLDDSRRRAIQGVFA